MRIFYLVIYLLLKSPLFAAGPSFNFPETKGPSTTPTYPVLSIEAHQDIVHLFENLPISFEEKVRILLQPRNIERLYVTYAPEIVHQLVTYGFINLNDHDTAMSYWETFGPHFPEEAHHALCQEALQGSGIFSVRSNEERFTFLTHLVERGGVGAEIIQQTLNHAAYNGELTFPAEGDSEYLQAIVERAGPGTGAEHAAQLLNNAAVDGRLGFSPLDLTYLSWVAEIVSFGSAHAQHLLYRLSLPTEVTAEGTHIHPSETADEAISTEGSDDESSTGSMPADWSHGDDDAEAMSTEGSDDTEEVSPWETLFMQTLRGLPR